MNFSGFEAGLGIRSFPHRSFTQIKLATVSNLLRSLKTNEQLWANRSGRLWQMNDCERFAQVANDKWANEQIARFFEGIAHSLFRSQKTSDSLKKFD